MLSQVVALGATQTIAWAASTYLIAILAAPIARDLGLSTSTVFGAFSVALVVMGLAGPAAGRAIDRWGGRGVLALFGAMTSYVTSAMAAHLPGLLIAAGTTALAAITASALLGPAQVASRLIEFLAARRFKFHPLLTARVATAFHPIGAAVLALFGGPAQIASLFALLHGAGNGMITIAKGTLPLAIFGPVGYGHRQGLLSMLGRGMQAIAPYTFGVVLEADGPRAALALSLGLSLVALAALLALRQSGHVER